MSVRMMVLVAAAGSLLGTTSAFASDVRPAPATFSPITASQVPAPVKRHVRKRTDITSTGEILIGVAAAGAVGGGIAAGTSGSSKSASSN